MLHLCEKRPLRQNFFGIFLTWQKRKKQKETKRHLDDVGRVVTFFPDQRNNFFQGTKSKNYIYANRNFCEYKSEILNVSQTFTLKIDKH